MANIIKDSGYSKLRNLSAEQIEIFKIFFHHIVIGELEKVTNKKQKIEEYLY